MSTATMTQSDWQARAKAVLLQADLEILMQDFCEIWKRIVYGMKMVMNLSII